MIDRIPGAIVRALLAMLVLAVPSLMLPRGMGDSDQVVAFLGFFAGVLIFVEYLAVYPGLIEFRDAPPYNRIRYVTLLLTVTILTAICVKTAHPSPFVLLAQSVGDVLGRVVDVPYSPVRLLTLMLPRDAMPDQIAVVRAAAGMAYLISLVMLAIFVLVLKLFGWPSSNGAFNVWVNLPTFDPTVGGDVVLRLERDARMNLSVGFLLPFVLPALMKVAADVVAPVGLTSPESIIWVVTAWAFLPASLFMRGIAMGRIADMIRDSRRRAREMEESFLPALSH